MYLYNASRKETKYDGLQNVIIFLKINFFFMIGVIEKSART